MAQAGQPDLLKCRVHRARVDGMTGKPRGESDVLEGGEGIKQVVGLKDEAHKGPAMASQLGLVESRQRRAGHSHVSRCGLVQPGSQMQERGFPGP